MQQKEFDHFFVFGTLSVTFRSPFLMLLSLFSSLFCQTPFAGLLLRQGDPWENKHISHRILVQICPRETFMNRPSFGLPERLLIGDRDTKPEKHFLRSICIEKSLARPRENPKLSGVRKRVVLANVPLERKPERGYVR